MCVCVCVCVLLRRTQIARISVLAEPLSDLQVDEYQLWAVPCQFSFVAMSGVHIRQLVVLASLEHCFLLVSPFRRATRGIGDKRGIA